MANSTPDQPPEHNAESNDLDVMGSSFTFPDYLLQDETVAPLITFAYRKRQHQSEILHLAEQRLRRCEDQCHILRREFEQSQKDYEDVERGFVQLRDHLMQMPPGTDFSSLALGQHAVYEPDSDASSFLSSEDGSP